MVLESGDPDIFAGHQVSDEAKDFVNQCWRR